MDDDWLDDKVRRSAADMLQVLFTSSRICVITFDARGVIVGVNPQTAALGGRDLRQYQGVSLLEHPILCRLGYGDALARVLAGDTVEATDTRWVTLFSGEERWVDIIAGPVMADARVVGGVAYLVDATAQHRAETADEAKRRRARELLAFVARDLGELVRPVGAWAESDLPSPVEAEAARRAARELPPLFDDLAHFVRLEGYEPRLERVPLRELARAFDGATGPALEDVVVYADARLLRRVLRNLALYRLRLGGGRWSVEREDGRVRLVCCFAPAAAPATLVDATTLPTSQADDPDTSLAAARWMAELMHGSLSVDAARRALCLELPAADGAAVVDAG